MRLWELKFEILGENSEVWPDIKTESYETTVRVVSDNEASGAIEAAKSAILKNGIHCDCENRTVEDIRLVELKEICRIHAASIEGQLKVGFIPEIDD